MKGIQSDNTFKFVSLRGAKKASNNTKKYLFININSSRGTSLIYNKLQELSKNNEVVSEEELNKLTQGFMKHEYYLKNEHVSEILGTYLDFFEWLEALPKLGSEHIKKELELRKLAPLDKKQWAICWDNLLYQYNIVERPNLTLLSLLCKILQIDHLIQALKEPINKYSSRELSWLLQATVLVPQECLIKKTVRTPNKKTNSTNKKAGKKDRKRKQRLKKVAEIEKAIQELHDLYEIHYIEAQITQNNKESEAVDSKRVSIFTKADYEHISDSTKSLVLRQKNPKNASIDYMINKLVRKAKEHLGYLNQEVEKNERIYPISNGLYAYKHHNSGGGHQDGIMIPDPKEVPDPYLHFYHPSDTKCRISPLILADLQVVKQELLCYKPGEVAHIENILAGEHKERKTRRLKKTIESITSYNEFEKEQERDTQTAERHELSQQSSSVVNQDNQISLGVNVAGSWGPVSVSSDFGYATSNSSQQSNSESVNYAKSVTERAIERIMNRVVEERQHTKIEEFEENNTHGIDNSDASNGHVVGVYRWVDKFYEVHVENYGKRLMFQLHIPEPAAMYLYNKQNELDQGGGYLEKPKHPAELYAELRPSADALEGHEQIDETNYSLLAAAYDVKVASPPASKKIVSKAIDHQAQSSVETGNSDDDTSGNTEAVSMFTKSYNEIKIPQGYEAYEAHATIFMVNTTNSFTNTFVMQIGSNQPHNNVIISPNGLQYWQNSQIILLNKENDLVPVTTYIEGTAIINIEIECLPAPEIIENWQSSVYDSIMTAYERKMQAYNEATAELEIQAGIQIEGNNPTLNREIEREELKRSSMLMIRRGQGLPSINSTMNEADLEECEYPEFHVCRAEAEGRHIQFLEQAFDWDKMTYELYPYFWARKCKWQELANLSDNDPIFRNFLKAGAARVLVPVKRGFEALAMHYLKSGRVWTGGPMPINDSLIFKNIMTELADADETVEVSEPWKVKLPTALTILQDGASSVDPTGGNNNGLPCFE